VVEKSGAIWWVPVAAFVTARRRNRSPKSKRWVQGALAMLDLPAAHYGGYYEGFANSALWPALHSRTDLISASQEDYLSYREVNAFMRARCCASRSPTRCSGFRIITSWPGAELRDLGVTQPTGFFLHTPWPARAIRKEVLTIANCRGNAAYDLIDSRPRTIVRIFSDIFQRTLVSRFEDGGG